MSLPILFHFLCAQHVSNINIFIIRSWSTTCSSACNTDTTPTQPHQISNAQRTENKTTDVVIQQYSRKLLMMDILMPETCWAHKEWNKIASDIKLVFYSSRVQGFCFCMTVYSITAFSVYKCSINNKKHTHTHTHTHVVWSDWFPRRLYPSPVYIN